MIREVIYNVFETTGDDVQIVDRLLEFPAGVNYLSRLEHENVYVDGQHFADFMYDHINKEYLFLISGEDTYADSQHMIMWSSDNYADIYGLFRTLSIYDKDKHEGYTRCMDIIVTRMKTWIKQNQPFIWKKLEL